MKPSLITRIVNENEQLRVEIEKLRLDRNQWRIRAEQAWKEVERLLASGDDGNKKDPAPRRAESVVLDEGTNS